MRKLTVLTLIILVAGLSLSCDEKKDKGVDLSLTPDLPPVESFFIDFSNFTSAGGNAQVESAVSVLSRDNWSWAALNVGFWSSVMTVTLAVPAASFAEAFNHDPVEGDNGDYIWTYNFRAGNNWFTAELHGKLQGTKVLWDMFITKADVYENFNWYSGESELAGSNGQWILNKDPQDARPFLQIDWARSTTSVEVKYTNIVPDGPNNGSYIAYKRTTENVYNGYYDIFNVTNSNLIEMKWNRQNRDGRIKDPVHFGDEQWHCWDENLDDEDCR